MAPGYFPTFPRAWRRPRDMYTNVQYTCVPLVSAAGARPSMGDSDGCAGVDDGDLPIVTGAFWP